MGHVGDKERVAILPVLAEVVGGLDNIEDAECHVNSHLGVHDRIVGTVCQKTQQDVDHESVLENWVFRGEEGNKQIKHHSYQLDYHEASESLLMFRPF